MNEPELAEPATTPAAPVEFSDMPGWATDDHLAAFHAFLIGARAMAERPPKSRLVDGEALAGAARQALAVAGRATASLARRFFEDRFRPQRIATNGFLTGYYEPQVAASRSRTREFPAPLYRPPAGLVEVAVGDRPPGWDPSLGWGIASPSGHVPCPDRAAIEAGALAGRGLELAWLKSPVDAFFIHVQGSARLGFDDGSEMRIAFAGKSGHPYTSIGRLAVERGLLKLKAADRDGLDAWLRRQPEEGLSLMRENRSFIFFRETNQHRGDGPIGAAGAPLAAGRSIAVDRRIHTFHTPLFVDCPELADFAHPDRPWRRLMIAHDTGSAIVGPARGDLYFGSGDAAGSRAGRVRHAATMFVLSPRVEP